MELTILVRPATRAEMEAVLSTALRDLIHRYPYIYGYYLQQDGVLFLETNPEKDPEVRKV